MTSANRAATTEAGTPYAGLVDAVCAQLPRPGRRDLLRIDAAAMHGPPSEEVGLEPFAPPGYVAGQAMSGPGALDVLWWEVPPYLALAVFAVGHVWRWRYDQFGWTSRSTQLQERRLLVPRVRATTSAIDYLALVLLLAVILTGVIPTVAVNLLGEGYNYRVTVAPWFRGLFTGSPDVSVMATAPVIYQIHATAAWAIWAVWPFSRLVHAWSYPLWYLWRPYVVYRSRARAARGARHQRPQMAQDRRAVLRPPRRPVPGRRPTCSPACPGCAPRARLTQPAGCHTIATSKLPRDGGSHGVP